MSLSTRSFKRLAALAVSVLALGAAAQASGQEGAERLKRIQQAAHHLNYAGVFAYQQGGLIESSLIVHQFDGKDERERIELLNGAPREYLRLNQDVQSLIPEERTVLREKQRVDRFPALLLANEQALDTNYSVRDLPQNLRIAGRPCQLVDVIAKDAHRYSYRLCVDTESQLLLKAQTVNHHGVVIEQVAFTQVSIGQEVTPQMLAPSWSTDGWAQVDVPQKEVDLKAQGWRVVPPPGYAISTQVTREFADQKHVQQMVLSDGLATISIFIEPYLNERSEYKPQGAAQMGSVNIYGIKVANFWLTVLGEVPAATLEQLAQSIQYVSVAGKK